MNPGLLRWKLTWESATCVCIPPLDWQQVLIPISKYDCLIPIPQLYSADLSTIIAHWALKTESSPRTLVIAPGVERSHAQILAAFLYEDERLRKAVRERGLEEEKRTRLTLRMGGASALAV
jgi:hypothetical protein